MGGYGSGYYIRFGTKETTEANRAIDIRFLKKKGGLEPGSSGSLQWSCRGQSSGSVRFEMHADTMILNYECSVAGGYWEDVTQKIQLDHTTPFFGGIRTWFLCPQCDRRVAALYGAGRLFLCRHCYGLTYASRQEQFSDRMISKAHKIRERLGGKGPVARIPRPKGMHRATYYRLVIAARQYEYIGMRSFLDRYK